MIRYLAAIAFTSLVILACKSESPRGLLIGTWRLKDIANAGDSIIETATFSKANSLLLKTTINGKIADTVNGSYELSVDNKYITTKIDTSTFRLEIIKLTKNFLELKTVGKMDVGHYIRYED